MPSLGFGVHLISRGEGDPATTPFPSHKVMLEDGVRVEKLGFDAVWLPDHYYFDRPSGIETFPEVWTLLTAIAMKTEKRAARDQRALGDVPPPGHDGEDGRRAPGALRRARSSSGSGLATRSTRTRRSATISSDRIGAFKEYLPIMTGLLKGETVTLEGRYFQLEDASLRTVVPHVPVWVASGGPQMFELTARYGHGWNMAGGGTDPAAIQEKYDGFAAACAAVGKNVKDFDVCKMTFTGIAPDDAAAKRMREELAVKSNISAGSAGGADGGGHAGRRWPSGCGR